LRAFKRKGDAIVFSEKNYWISLRDNLTQQRVVVENNEGERWHYIIGKEDKNLPNSVKGFCGRKFIVHFNNGEIVETTNLWEQDRVPEEFLNDFLVNAIVEDFQPPFSIY